MPADEYDDLPEGVVHISAPLIAAFERIAERCTPHDPDPIRLDELGINPGLVAELAAEGIATLDDFEARYGPLDP